MVTLRLSLPAPQWWGVLTYHEYGGKHDDLFVLFRCVFRGQLRAEGEEQRVANHPTHCGANHDHLMTPRWYAYRTWKV